MRHINQPGTYALVYQCTTPFRASVGKLRSMEGRAGYWIYVGSAFGPGGLKARLRHHLKPSPRRHWHLDYIKAALQPLEIWATADSEKREHAWVKIVSGLQGSTCPMVGFGATDCTCRSHLIFRARRPGFSNFRRQIRRQIPGHGPIHRLVPADILARP